MRNAIRFRVVVFLAVAVLYALQIGCDPRKDALALFASKGLNLLSPARDYIQPGGMVFLPKGGIPEYDDPADGIVGDEGTLTDFRAEILQETLKKTSKFSAALSLAKTILPMSIGASGANDRDVTLGEIQTTGVRLKTTQLDALIKMPNTSDAALKALNQNERVFIVQEVLKATSLDLSATSGAAFDVHYNDGKAVVDCKKAAQDNSKNATNDSSSSTSKNSTKNQASTSKQQGTPESTTGKKAAKTSTKNTSSGSSPSATTPDGTSSLTAGLGFCVDGTYTLKMNAKAPIPFAVRLAELKIVGGTLQRKHGSKTFVSTLGDGEEISGSLVDDEKPLIAKIARRVKR